MERSHKHDAPRIDAPGPDDSRICPIPGCHTAIKDIFVLCTPHWMALSPSLQKRLVNAFRAYERDDDKQGVARRYMLALRDAMAAINMIQGGPDAPG